VAARAIGFEGFFMFAGHSGILRQFGASGMVTCMAAWEWGRRKKTAFRKYRAPSKYL
jgi:hypothetical protein